MAGTSQSGLTEKVLRTVAGVVGDDTTQVLFSMGVMTPEKAGARGMSALTEGGYATDGSINTDALWDDLRAAGYVEKAGGQEILRKSKLERFNSPEASATRREEGRRGSPPSKTGRW